MPDGHGPRTRRTALSRLVGLLVGAACVLACSGTGPAVAQVRDTPDDAFYQPPDLSGGTKPGTLLRAEPLTAPDGVLVWAILYVSTAMNGAPTAVSGLLAVPTGSAPATGRPIVAYAHGTTGLADACAPSKQGASESELAAIATPFIEAGDAIVFTDYEGLGTPGPHPYIVGTSEGQSVLDSVRAAKAVPGASAGQAVGLVGHSQGGHAVLWAAQLAPGYAPDLDIRGVVAAAPAGDLPAIATWLVGADSGQRAWLNAALLTSSWHAVYGLPLDQVAPAALPLVDALQTSCPGDVHQPSEPPLTADLGTVPAWRAQLDANTPGQTRTAAPLLVMQGTADEQIPFDSTNSEVKRLCAIGDTVDYRVVQDGVHSDALFAQPQLDAAVSWVGDRLAGSAAASTCP